MNFAIYRSKIQVKEPSGSPEKLLVENLKVEKLVNEKSEISKVNGVVASLKINPTDEEYNMDHKRRGTCLIFSHKNFSFCGLPQRKGTEKDANDLKDCFKKLGFDVKLYEDLLVCEMRAILRAG
jgi:caspase-1